VENADEEIDAAVRPDIRVMTVKLVENVKPQLHLPIIQQWTSATPGDINILIIIYPNSWYIAKLPCVRGQKEFFAVIERCYFLKASGVFHRLFLFLYSMRNSLMLRIKQEKH